MSDTSFETACALIAGVLAGPSRREIVAAVAAGSDGRQALRRLREHMRTHAWRMGPHTISLDAPVQTLDRRVRADGFHVLHDWDGKAERVNADMIAINVLDYVIDKCPSGPPNTNVLAILVDYYFSYLLMLLATDALGRANAGKDLDALNHLVALLQGPDGSGQLFAADAETLFLIGTSHFESKEGAYDTVLARARQLPFPHRRAIALGHAATLGSHLRFGYQVTYVKSYQLMRDDNGVDYRWLAFALSVLMEEYERQAQGGWGGIDRGILIEAIVNGLSADPAAFLIDPPHASFTPHLDEWSGLRDRLLRYRGDLLDAFKACRPLDRAYSPLALFFNFSHNVLKGTVADALNWGDAWHVSFNDLLTGVPEGDPRTLARQKLARTLMAYATAHPDSIGGRLSPVIVYDPTTGRRLFAEVIRCLEAAGASVSA
jgi:hypothetical protein